MFLAGPCVAAVISDVMWRQSATRNADAPEGPEWSGSHHGLCCHGGCPRITELTLTLSCFREKIHYLRTEGAQGVEKLSCDADLVILLR